MAVYTCQRLYIKDLRAESMSRVRVPVEIPIDTLAQTTTFYTQDELVKMVHNRRPGFDFENMNKTFSCSGGADCLILQYGGVKVGELGFSSNYDYDEDMPKFEEHNGKFRVYIANFHGYRGSQAPFAVPIRPEAYNTSMKLGWKYKDTDDPEIDIFRVDDDNLLKPENVIYTLRRNDFDTNGQWWLNNCNPIVIQKHQTYISICASSHLKRSWAGQLADRWRTRASCKCYIMSPDEVAWISDDDWRALKHFRLANAPQALGGQLHTQAPAQPHTLSRMLGLLREI